MSLSSKLVGLRFLLQHGSFLNIATHEAHARELVRQWIAGKNNLIMGDGDFKAGPWGVKADTIVGMHTFDLQATAQMQQERIPGLPR